LSNGAALAVLLAGCSLLGSGSLSFFTANIGRFRCGDGTGDVGGSNFLRSSLISRRVGAVMRDALVILPLIKVFATGVAADKEHGQTEQANTDGSIEVDESENRLDHGFVSGCDSALYSVFRQLLGSYLPRAFTPLLLVLWASTTRFALGSDLF